MPKGRSKGFGHYMCKKFFHPGNPENLERVYVAREKAKAKDAAEVEKMREYEKEQELWNNRNILASKTHKDKMSLSFMYEPPVGLKKEEKIKDPKDEFKFEWQKNAPREKHCKEDPNIVDHPFGINVQFTKCIRCQVWGHSHTDKQCPNYGKARDAEEEPVRVINEKELIKGMKDRDNLQFTNYGVWDNGKVAKQYDLIYSSEEEGSHGDLMSGLLKEIRGKEKRIEILRSKVKKVAKKGKKSKKSPKSEKSSKVKKSSKSSPRSKSSRKSDRRKKRETAEEVKVKIEPPPTEMSAESRTAYLKQIDDILFSDIGTRVADIGSSSKTAGTKSGSNTSSGSSTPVAGASREDSSFLSEVDKILGIESEDQSESSGESGVDEDEDDDEDDDDDDCDDEVPEKELTESEMRLLNLIQIKKIDVKANFEEKYKDSNCHFCRTLEDSAHLAVCPVYDDIMEGTEFNDIKSEDTGVVKQALINIRKALHERSRTLSVTSIGTISTENMKLLDLPGEGDKDERTRRALAILESA